VLGAERINLSDKVVAIVGEDGDEFLNDRLRADLTAQQNAAAQRNAEKSASELPRANGGAGHTGQARRK
jgi:hypothetical protein